MNKTEIDRITNKMLVIKGQPLNEIVRTSSMLCLGFGDKVKGKTAYKTDEGLTTVLDPENQLLSVKEIHVNIFGDLKVILSNNYCIETFTDTSEEEECWRFFEMGNTEAPHIVVKGSSIFEE